MVDRDKQYPLMITLLVSLEKERSGATFSSLRRWRSERENSEVILSHLKKIVNRCRYFFVVFLFFCSEICQVNNYKRQALYLLIVKSGTL